MNRANRISALYVLVLVLGAVCLLVTIPVCSKKSTEPPPPQDTPSALTLDSLSAKSATALLLSGTDSSSVTISIGANARTWKGFDSRSVPSIRAIGPMFATYGAQLTVWGDRFLTGNPTEKRLFIGDVEAPWHEWTENAVLATVPNRCISGDVRVCKDGRYWSNGVALDVLGIVSIEPSHVWQGDTVTVVGSEFGKTQGTSEVLLNSVPMPVISWSDDTLLVCISGDVRSGQLLVQVGETLSNSIRLVIYTTDLPIIDSIKPTLCTFGTQFTIWGENFDDGFFYSHVFIGEIDVPRLEWSETVIVAKVPFGLASDDVRLCRAYDYWSNAVPMTIFGITEVEPATAQVGDTVAIIGTGFGGNQGTGALLLDGIPIPVLSWSDEKIRIIAMDGYASGQLTVEKNGVTSNATAFWVLDDETTILDLLNMTNSMRLELQLMVQYTTGGTGDLNLYSYVGPGTHRIYGELDWDSSDFMASDGYARGDGVYYCSFFEDFGIVDTDAGTLDSLGCGYKCFMYCQPNEPGACSNVENEYRFSIDDLPLASVETENTIRITYSATGHQLAGIIKHLYASYRHFGWSDGPGGYNSWDYTHYVDEILWDDPEVVPHLTVTFEQR